MTHQNKKINKLAKIMLVLLAISGTGMWWSYDKYSSVLPPMFLDSSPSYGVVFNAGDTLCRTDESESLLYTARYARLGLHDVSDVKFLDEGIILVQADGAIKRCDLQLGWCETIGNVPSGDTDIVQRIIPSTDRTTFYIVQTNASRIDKFNRSGRHLYRLPLSTDDLKYPGGGMALPDDRLLLSDPKHKKVVVVHDQGQTAAPILYTLSTEESMEGRGYTKPFSAKLDTRHHLWINLANKAYSSSDTLIIESAALDAYLKEQTPLPTTESLTLNITAYMTDRTLEYPVSLAPHREGMLIADEDAYVIRYAEEGSVSRPFGDTSTQKLLAKVLKARSTYWYILLFFGGVGIVGMIVGLSGAAAEMAEIAQAKTTQESPAQLPPNKIIQPNEKEVIWLETGTKFRKNIRIMRWLMLAVTSSLIPLSLFIFQKAEILASGEAWKIFAMEGLFAILAIALFWLRIEDQSIGTDGKHIFIQTTFGKQAYAPFEEVIFTGNRVIVDNRAIALFPKGEALFDQEQLDYYISPLLDKAKELNEFELLIWQSKNNPWQFIWTIGAITISIILTIYVLLQ